MSERKASLIDNSGWVDCDYLGWNIDTTVENLFYASGDIWWVSVVVYRILQIPALQDLLLKHRMQCGFERSGGIRSRLTWYYQDFVLQQEGITSPTIALW